ncbi:MAG: hypothetical protein HY791_34290 [Deltaproteobacteria bacterium]|nr:hypothetical protein [Deltaproteobacteria bacterium]
MILFSRGGSREVEFGLMATRAKHFGTCGLCKQRFDKAGMTRHLKTCVPAHDAATAPRTLVWIRVEGFGPYWLDLEVAGSSTLAPVDRFLRDIWLECCGHLSAFTIEGERYESAPDEEYGEGESLASGRIERVFGVPGLKADYAYDFGSTTELELKVVGVRIGSGGRARGAVRLLARNEAPEANCVVCGQPATVICTAEGEEYLCKTHEPSHKCGFVEGHLPVVNSPRCGVCGYTG